MDQVLETLRYYHYIRSAEKTYCQSWLAPYSLFFPLSTFHLPLHKLRIDQEPGDFQVFAGRKLRPQHGNDTVRLFQRPLTNQKGGSPKNPRQQDSHDNHQKKLHQRDTFSFFPAGLYRSSSQRNFGPAAAASASARSPADRATRYRFFDKWPGRTLHPAADHVKSAPMPSQMHIWAPLINSASFRSCSAW